MFDRNTYWHLELLQEVIGGEFGACTIRVDDIPKHSHESIINIFVDDGLELDVLQ